MDTTKEQVLKFLEKCGELSQSKFIMFSTKLKDLLKCIVNSPDLYRLFESVTKDYSYPEQKSRCFVTKNDGFFNKNYIILPEKPADRLAFIFCLLVELDRESINFNNLLEKYFYSENFDLSYISFCKLIIYPLEDLIKQAFKERLNKSGGEIPSDLSDGLSGLFSAIGHLLDKETKFIQNSQLPDEEKENGAKILGSLLKAVKDGDVAQIEAALCGYNYFVLYNKVLSDGIELLIQTIAEYVGVLS